MIELNRTYTYEELFSCICDLECQFPDILKLSIIGMSHDERRIPMLKLGSSQDCLICSAGIHGRESINPILMVKMAEEYCQRYADDLNGGSICFLPLMNPDGYEIALKGYQAVRNPKLRHSIMMDGIPAKEWKYNGRGIDINRNFPSRSFLPRGRMFHPASENETKALMDVFAGFSESVGYIDFHSRGQIIYYYRNAMPEVYNEESERMAKHLQVLANYELGSRAEEFETQASGGNSVNYYSEKYKRPAITIETVADEAAFPLDKQYQEQTYEEIRKVPLTFLKECRK